MNNNLLYQVLEYIDNNITNQISIQELSNSLYFNKDYIMRIFKKKFNITIIKYINLLKIYKNLSLYKNKHNSITYISICSSFNELEYYTRTFTSIFNVSPSKFKKFNTNRFSLPKDTYNQILSKLLEIDTLMNNINKFKEDNKPRYIPDTLSIFKTLKK